MSAVSKHFEKTALGRSLTWRRRRRRWNDKTEIVHQGPDEIEVIFRTILSICDALHKAWAYWKTHELQQLRLISTDHEIFSKTFEVALRAWQKAPAAPGRKRYIREKEWKRSILLKAKRPGYTLSHADPPSAPTGYLVLGSNQNWPDNMLSRSQGIAECVQSTFSMKYLKHIPVNTSPLNHLPKGKRRFT